MVVVPASAFPRAMLAALQLTELIPRSVLQADPRISYEAYVPDAHYPDVNDTTKLPLLVAIHSTGRETSRIYNVWQEFAESHKCAILTPTFSGFLQAPLDLDGYHVLGRGPPFKGEPAESWLEAAVKVPDNYKVTASTSADPDTDLRYDLLLLNLLDEVSTRWPGIDTSKVFLTGFSGGAQFVHRFAYLHPERLLAVSIGAPGSTTLIDYNQTWPTGIQNIEDVFGQTIDFETLKIVPMLASVGSNDTGEGIPRLRLNVPGSNFGTPEEEGQTRVEKTTQLVENWKKHGLNATLIVVPGPEHEMEKVHPAVELWIEKLVRAWWAEKET